ncbi:MULTISPECIES: hypothetical protein [Shewanella]|jgi:hypothetical protein|uniref:Uncharacterized protein n=2 Tax=Shewanella TaxID=22 RepID=A0AAE4TRC1_9GAMM|nr:MULTISPECIES: hypothetical protein [Shewanella]MCK7657684.1 hypothetical protein [Shewanella sp. JNE4-2]MDH0451004.1 hypothetical protein [Shewanella sp. GD04112]MDV5393144.1 hypothetical protein [Shewanella xiamenensis]
MSAESMLTLVKSLHNAAAQGGSTRIPPMTFAELGQLIQLSVKFRAEK